MKLYSYIVAGDGGFAPNPFHGVCTLACCKPKIRKNARVGDLVVGLSRRSERFVYAMEVARVLTFEAYWGDRRYRKKRPKMSAPDLVRRRGDNIYEPIRPGTFRQHASNHSHPDGTEHLRNKQKDLGGEHVLVARRFVYFGGDGPPVPARLAFLRAGRGHRSKFTDEEIARVRAWFASQPQGVRSSPAHWADDDRSWRPSCG